MKQLSTNAVQMAGLAAGLPILVLAIGGLAGVDTSLALLAALGLSIGISIWFSQELQRQRKQAEDTSSEVHNAQLKLGLAKAQIQDLAREDESTHLPNRRSLEEELDKEWARAERSGHPLAVIILDVDHFYAYKEQFGRQQADAAFRRVAEVVQREVGRPGDILARYGEEELAIVLPDTDLEGAENISERIRRSVEAEQIPHPKSKVSSYLTVSAGVAIRFPAKQKFAADLLRVADQLMYRAKEEGRNRTACFDFS